MQLVIGDKAYSSWSMRPWLVLKRLGAPFEEVPVKLRQATTPDAIASLSPSGKIPVLKDGDLVVWDSLAICEYLADRNPEAGLWPRDAAARALARSAAAEMHSGFPSVRGEFSMDLLAAPKVALISEASRPEIRRLVALWSSLRQRFGQDGPFLFGDWTIADAFFTPVASRFQTYGIKLSDFGDLGDAGRYAEVLLEQPHFLEWVDGAKTGA